MARPASGKAFHFGKRKTGCTQIAASSRDGGHDRQRIIDPVRAGLGDGVAQLARAERPRERGGDQRAATGRGHGIEQARIGLRTATEAHDITRMARGGFAQQREVGVVGGDDRHAASFQSLEDLGLGVGDGFLAREVADMRRRDGGDDGDVRAHQPGQRGEFARVVHPHLEHAEARARRHAREAERHADMVVVALDRAMHCARCHPVERVEQRLLGAGLARRSGHADDRRAGPRARGMAERGERGGAIRHQHMRVIDRLLADHARRACRHRAVDEQMPVGRLAAHRDEQVARLDFAGIERDAGHLELRRGGAASCLRELGGRPEAHAAHSRATWTSSNGSTRSPTI